jgi:hypothetical protein
MDLSKTSSVFHLLIDIKRHLIDCRAAFSKPHCSCLVTAPKHQSFWLACADMLDDMDKMSSLTLQMLCETQDCTCLEKTEITSCLDLFFNLAQALFFVLNQYKDHRQQGQTLSMLENEQLFNYFDLVSKKVHRYTNKLLQILHYCSKGHNLLVTKYSLCPMDE